MPKVKTTIMVDPVRLAEAKRLSGVSSASAVIDLALARLVREEAASRHVAAYAASPAGEDERHLGEVPVAFDLQDADVDYDALYGTRDE